MTCKGIEIRPIDVRVYSQNWVYKQEDFGLLAILDALTTHGWFSFHVERQQIFAVYKNKDKQMNEWK